MHAIDGRGAVLVLLAALYATGLAVAVVDGEWLLVAVLVVAVGVRVAARLRARPAQRAGRPRSRPRTPRPGGTPGTAHRRRPRAAM